MLFQISEYVDELANAYPKLCKTEIIGTTHEGRDIKVIKVRRVCHSSPKVAERNHNLNFNITLNRYDVLKRHNIT